MNQRVSQLDRTRGAIVAAAAEIIFGATNPDDITMQAIADAAGVSHRTLYRHFPGRTDLINEVGRRFDVELGERAGITDPTDLGEWVDGIESAIAFGATNRETLRRALIVSISGGEFRSDRDEMYWRQFREAFPHLDESEARHDYIAIRHLLGSSNVILVGERFQLPPEELVEVIGRSIATLLRDVERRDAEAAEVRS